MTGDNFHSEAAGGDLLERELTEVLFLIAGSVEPATPTAAHALAAATARTRVDPLAHRRRATTVSLAAAAAVLTVVGVVAITADGSDPLQVGSEPGLSVPSSSPDSLVATSVVQGPVEVASELLEVAGAPLPAPDPSSPTPELFEAATAPTVPTITGPTWDGSAVTIAPGVPRLIVVIAHWCPHCQRELPVLRSMLSDGTIPSTVEFTVVSTAVDPTRGNFPPSSWIQASLSGVAPLIDDGASTGANALGATSFPMFLAVDADGRLRARGTGELDADQVGELVATIAP